MNHILLFITEQEMATLFVVFVVIIIAIFWKKRVNVSVNAVHAFSDHQFSTQDFYTQLTDLIRRREMPEVKIERVNHAISSMFSTQQEYLRVSRNDSIFDICAAPFGTGSFVSYWLGEPRKTLKQLAKRVATTYINNPDVQQIMDNFDSKTRYQYDTDAVFIAWVKECITEAIEEMKANKGVRISPEELVNPEA